MSKYFNDLPPLDLDFEAMRARAENLTEEEFQKVVAEFEASSATQEDRLRFIERIEKDGGGRISWDMPYPFEEYARRVRAGEDL